MTATLVTHLAHDDADGTACLLNMTTLPRVALAAGGGQAGGTAQSLTCDECHTILKDVAAAELHATKVPTSSAP